MTPAELRAKLEALGTTADEVADTLRAKGVRAVRGRLQCTSCPIAVYMGGNTIVTPDESGWDPLGAAVRADNPPAVSEFIRRYDAGDFPDLQPEGT